MRLLALAAACAGAYGQVSGVIEGTITDSVTKAGVRRALVMINGYQPGVQPVQLMTDASGHFAARGLAAGDYTVSANHMSYLMFLNEAVKVSVSAEKTRHTVNLQMTPGAVIRGRVMTEDGEPCEAQVMAAKPNSLPMYLGGASTEPDGEYTISGLLPGRYVVAVRPHCMPFQPVPLQPVKQPLPRRRGTGYGITFFPDSASAGTAEPVLVRAASVRTDVDFRLKAAALADVDVAVTGAEPGRPVNVWVKPEDQTGPYVDASAGVNDGVAQIVGLRAGTYRLFAAEIGDPMTCRVGSAPLAVREAGLLRAEVRLAPTPPVRVQVRDLEGKPMKLGYRLDSLNEAPSPPPAVDGELMRCLSPGPWSVEPFDMGKAVVSVRVGTETFRGAVLRVPEAVPDLMVITVAQATSRLQVNVDAGEQAAKVLVLRESEYGRRGVWHWQPRSSANVVPAGRYRLLAVPENMPTMPGLLEALAEMGEVVELKDGEERVVNLAFLSAEKIRLALEK
ncbi:MAG: carboxypeptidase regulatory-like domain-containing protein [Bryobacteraceae bacterium]|nr:carboxypeptidase regulatory-like domain-containing protein [Bryobacteraceae bacterium]